MRLCVVQLFAGLLPVTKSQLVVYLVRINHMSVYCVGK